MKTLGKLLIVFVGLLAITPALAQDGKNPYVGSTHNYKITRGMTESVLAWGIPSGTVGGTDITPALDTHYKIISGGGDSEYIDIQWLVEGTFTIELSETRTAASGFAGCPTVRQLVVTVGANAFDVYAELKEAGKADACATIDPSVVVDVAGDGKNNNDVFGVTKREFVVTAVNATGNWDFTYTLTHKNGGADENVGDLAVKIGTSDISATGETINVTDGSTTKTITVTYTTNDNRQDKDFDLVFTITDAKDSLNTPDGDGTAGKSDAATYIVRALPATTGITTD